jgi:hypothetical protein
MDRLDDGLDDGRKKEAKTWERLQASAQPGFDPSGRPVLQMRVGEELAQVGLSRANILSASGSPELAAGLMEARLRQELRSAIARKTARSDVEEDLVLFQQLLSRQPRNVAATPSSKNNRRDQARASLE